jgi:rubredoxin
MTNWKCSICGWIYDPIKGVPKENIGPGTPFEAIADSFRCPKCKAMKKYFEEIDE